MNWQFLQPRHRGFEITMSQSGQTACVLSDVTDYRHMLLPDEAQELAPMAEVRQIGFASGRHCAHLAQSQLGLAPEAIARQDRVPIWPKHCVGSITHSSSIAAAIASTQYLGVGIDIEEVGRVEDKLFRMLFTENEKAHIAKMGTNSPGLDAAGIIFSAKEAGYKAIYPLGQRFIGFKEAEIRLDVQHQTFTIIYLGDHEPNQALNRGQGYWQCHEAHILTVFTIAD